MATQADRISYIDKSPRYILSGETLYLQGTLKITQCNELNRTLLKKNKHMSMRTINLDQLTYIDSAGVATLCYLQNKWQEQNKTLNVTGGNDSIKERIELFRPAKQPPKPSKKREGFLYTSGLKAQVFFSYYVLAYLSLSAEVFYWAIHDVFSSQKRRKGEVVNQAVLIGVQATAIVCLMSFIIGVVLAAQSASQLKEFGANIYIVDLTVIGMLNQMGPLITAILIAGRSGSAIAAEIASMQVTSEIDALRTMGLQPIRFVVVPKLYACLLIMPFLIAFASLFGIAGGAVVAHFQLDITPEVFINKMESVVKIKYLFTNLLKSQAYALLIVITGSFYGFRATRGAEGVGKSTTQSVVLAISLVIMADSIIDLIFY